MVPAPDRRKYDYLGRKIDREVQKNAAEECGSERWNVGLHVILLVVGELCVSMLLLFIKPRSITDFANRGSVRSQSRPGVVEGNADVKWGKGG
jgi:hypothetical protein